MHVTSAQAGFRQCRTTATLTLLLTLVQLVWKQSTNACHQGRMTNDKFPIICSCQPQQSDYRSSCCCSYGILQTLASLPPAGQMLFTYTCDAVFVEDVLSVIDPAGAPAAAALLRSRSTRDFWKSSPVLCSLRVRFLIPWLTK